MARIPDSELERLKREVSLERLVTAHGVKLKRHGQDLLGLCPFHDDREPSVVVSPEKNLWHCLGARQKGGTAIDWVMQVEGISFRHVVELLRHNDSTPQHQPPTQAKKHSRVGKLASPVSSEAKDCEALEKVISFYQQTLQESPEALAYLESRGLHSQEAIEHFRLGFANR